MFWVSLVLVGLLCAATGFRVEKPRKPSSHQTFIENSNSPKSGAQPRFGGSRSRKALAWLTLKLHPRKSLALRLLKASRYRSRVRPARMSDNKVEKGVSGLEKIEERSRDKKVEKGVSGLEKIEERSRLRSARMSDEKVEKGGSFGCTQATLEKIAEEDKIAEEKIAHLEAQIESIRKKLEPDLEEDQNSQKVEVSDDAASAAPESMFSGFPRDAKARQERRESGPDSDLELVVEERRYGLVVEPAKDGAVLEKAAKDDAFVEKTAKDEAVVEKATQEESAVEKPDLEKTAAQTEEAVVEKTVEDEASVENTTQEESAVEKPDLEKTAAQTEEAVVEKTVEDEAVVEKATQEESSSAVEKPDSEKIAAQTEEAVVEKTVEEETTLEKTTQEEETVVEKPDSGQVMEKPDSGQAAAQTATKEVAAEKIEEKETVMAALELAVRSIDYGSRVGSDEEMRTLAEAIGRAHAIGLSKDAEAAEYVQNLALEKQKEKAEHVAKKAAAASKKEEEQQHRVQGQAEQTKKKGAVWMQAESKAVKAGKKVMDTAEAGAEKDVGDSADVAGHDAAETSSWMAWDSVHVAPMTSPQVEGTGKPADRVVARAVLQAAVRSVKDNKRTALVHEMQELVTAIERARNVGLHEEVAKAEKIQQLAQDALRRAAEKKAGPKTSTVGSNPFWKSVESVAEKAKDESQAKKARASTSSEGPGQNNLWKNLEAAAERAKEAEETAAKKVAAKVFSDNAAHKQSVWNAAEKVAEDAEEMPHPDAVRKTTDTQTVKASGSNAVKASGSNAVEASGSNVAGPVFGGARFAGNTQTAKASGSNAVKASGGNVWARMASAAGKAAEKEAASDELQSALRHVDIMGGPQAASKGDLDNLAAAISRARAAGLWEAADKAEVIYRLAAERTVEKQKQDQADRAIADRAAEEQKRAAKRARAAAEQAMEHKAQADRAIADRAAEEQKRAAKRARAAAEQAMGDKAATRSPFDKPFADRTESAESRAAKREAAAATASPERWAQELEEIGQRRSLEKRREELDEVRNILRRSRNMPPEERKRVLYKLQMKWHPDRLKDETEKELGNIVLLMVNEILNQARNADSFRDAKRYY